MRSMAVDDLKRDSLCEIHPTNKVVLYCKSCDQLICTKCVSHSGEAKHTDHVYLELVEAYDIGKEELEKMLAGFRDDLNQKRGERQELHTKLQKLQLSLLRKKTELSKSCRALQDCLTKKEKSFMGEVDGIVEPAIQQCEGRFKDVEVDVLSRDGLLSSSEAIQKLPPSRILTFLKSLGSIKKELQKIRRRTFTEYDESMFQVSRLDDVHLNLTREKYMIDKAFTLPSKEPEAPRILPGWCVVGQNGASLVWKFNKSNTIKQFHVYFKPCSSQYHDRKYTSHYQTKTKEIQIKERVRKPRLTTKKKSSSNKKQDINLKRWSKSNDLNVKVNQRKQVSNNEKEQQNKEESLGSLHGQESKPKWWQMSPWRKGTNRSQSTPDAASFSTPFSNRGKQEAEGNISKGDSPPWFVVEPVKYVENLSGQEQEVHDNLQKSIALTEALRKRSQGLRKKSSLSDQYLYTSVFRPKNESTALFGSKEKLQKQETIKEHDSKEKLDVTEKEVDTVEQMKMKEKVFKHKKISHSYTAIDSKLIAHDDSLTKIKISKFVPGRVNVTLRDLDSDREYMVFISAVNQCGESEAVVVHLKTSGYHSQSTLQTIFTSKSKRTICYNALGYVFTLMIFLIGLGLYGFLVFYLFSNHVQQRTCDRLIETFEDIDPVSMRSVCPTLTSDYACQRLNGDQSESWIHQAFDYFATAKGEKTQN